MLFSQNISLCKGQIQLELSQWREDWIKYDYVKNFPTPTCLRQRRASKPGLNDFKSLGFSNDAHSCLQLFLSLTWISILMRFNFSELIQLPFFEFSLQLQFLIVSLPNSNWIFSSTSWKLRVPPYRPPNLINLFLTSLSYNS